MIAENETQRTIAEKKHRINKCLKYNQMKKNLTVQQKQFAQAYADGLSATKAYKKAYNCKDKKDALIAYHANKLLNNELIKQEIQEKQEKTASFLNYDSEQSFNKIKEIQALCLEKKDFTNALKAEEMACKLAGLFKQDSGILAGAVGDFKEFYAAICAKKDYGNAKEGKTQSKNEYLSISPKN